MEKEKEKEKEKEVKLSKKLANFFVIKYVMIHLNKTENDIV